MPLHYHTEIELSAGEQQRAGAHARYAGAGVSRCAARRSVQLHGVAARGGASATARHMRDLGDMRREMGERWARNMLLNKWLEYCAERGHRFEAAVRPRNDRRNARCGVLTAEHNAHHADVLR